MRPIDADAFECVCTTLPDEVDRASYFAGMLAGMDAILKRIDDAPTIQLTDMWVSVADELPPLDTDVLILGTGKDDAEDYVVAISSYVSSLYGFSGHAGWRLPWQYFSYHYKITHWMPLPGRPETGGEKVAWKRTSTR